MSDNKPRCFSKKYGSRKEVFDGVACMTRGGLVVDDLFLDNDGVIRSVKQCESLKKSEANLVKKEKKQNKEVVSKPVDEDDSEGSEPVVNNSDVEEESASRRRRTKAVPTKALNICDIKEAVTKTLEKNNDKLPKGHSKWKKNDWLNKARELELVQ
jgi:hypothetical protein